MELTERLTLLEHQRAFAQMRALLEHSLAESSSQKERSQLHFRLGRLLRGQFLLLAAALKHLQDAYKLDPEQLDCLRFARAIYWETGRVSMVQKLLEIELKAIDGGASRRGLLLELALAREDAGDVQAAIEAVQSINRQDDVTIAELRGLRCTNDSWQEEVAEILRTANSDGGAYFRASRIARRFALGEEKQLLLRAYQCDPLAHMVAARVATVCEAAGELEALWDLQQRLAASAPSPAARADRWTELGVLWDVRLAQPLRARSCFEAAYQASPVALSAFVRLLEDNTVARASLASMLLEALALPSIDESSRVFALAQLGLLQVGLGRIDAARVTFLELAKVSPGHPELPPSFVGESVLAGAPPRDPSAVEPVTVKAMKSPLNETPVASESIEPVSHEAAREAPAADDAKIAELRALAEKQDGAKRYNEYVKTLLQLAAAVGPRDEKIEFFLKAADMFVNRFANQAEAIKAYEAILALDPDHHSAVEQLRQMYEKRRDWEKLLVLQRRDAERLPVGSERAARFFDIAKLATERVKKPEVCIDLWQEVLESDASNGEALSALAGLYERAKEFDKLATTLERQVDVSFDSSTKVALLVKLGTLYGDRLGNDEGAVAAWRALLAIDPNDRRAQDALKRKLLTLGRWDDIEALYAESGKWDEFIRLLEQQEAKETATETKLQLLFKLAELWSEKKQKSDRAARVYEKVLELDAQNLPAAEALIPIYTASGNAKALVVALEVKLHHQSDESDRLELLRQLGGLYEGKLKEFDKALDRYLAVVGIVPSDDEGREDAERAARAATGFPLVVAKYQELIKGADRGLAMDLRLRMGRILADELGKTEEALEAYGKVYADEPDNPAALSALQGLYRQLGRYAELREVLDRRLASAVDVTERRSLQLAIAALYEKDLNDDKSAVAAYELILEDTSDDVEALRALDALYGRLGDHAKQADILLRRIETETDRVSIVELKFRLAELQRKYLRDVDSSLENYREILKVDVEHQGAREALESLLADHGHAPAAAQVLEPVYRARADWENLVSVLRTLADSASDVTVQIEHRVQLARVSAQQTGDLSRAYVALSEALSIDSAREDVRQELESLADLGSFEAKLVSLYESLAKAVTDGVQKREYWFSAARLRERLGELPHAIEDYQHLLEIEGADEDALSALEVLFTRTERYADLIGVLERRIEQTLDNDRRELLLTEVATIYDTRLSKAADAIAAYQKIIDASPNSRVALLALDHIFSREKRYEDLAGNLEAQLATVFEDAEQVALLLRLADVRETKLDQVDVALELYRSVFEKDVGNREALARVEALGNRSEHELAVAELTEGLYRQLGRSSNLIATYEVQIRHATDAVRKVEILHQVAQLEEDALGDFNAAFATYSRALDVEPTNEGSQEHLERLARTTGKYAEQAGVYETLAKKSDDPAIAAALFATSARVYEVDLQQFDAAIRLYVKVLEIDAAHLGAVVALERLYRATNSYESLSKILQVRAELSASPDEQKEALFQAAAIEEEVLARIESAVAVYRKVLQVDPEDVRALDALIRNLRALSQFDALLDAYQRKIDITDGVESKRALLYDVADIYELNLRDSSKAIETYQRVLELDPDDRHSLSKLDALFEQTGNHTELLAILGRETELSQSPEELVHCQYRTAQLYEVHLNEPARAIEIYREILQADPSHERTLAALEQLKSGAREALAAATVLETHYELTGAWAKLVSALEAQVRLATEAYQQVDLLHRMGRLQEEALGDLQGAFDFYARALVLDSANENSLSNLERLSLQTNAWLQVAALYDAEVERLAGEPDRFVDLALRSAQIFEVQLDDVHGAIVRYRRVTEADPNHPSAVRSLDRLYLQTERWTDLVPVLQKETEIADSPDEILELKFRLGQVYQHRLSDLDAAVSTYRDILNAAPDHEQTLEATEALFASAKKPVELSEILEPIYRQNEQWEKLVGVHEAQLGAEADAGARLALYLRIAEVYEDRLGHQPGAFGVFQRALAEFPLEDKLVDEVVRLAGAVDNGWELLAHTYADIVASSTDREVQKLVGRRLAQTFEDNIGDISKAEESYKYVLQIDAGDHESLINLDRIYASLEAWPELARTIEMRIDATEDEHDLVELHGRLGEVYEHHLGNVANAMHVYRRLFDGLDRSHEGAIAALARIYEAQGAWAELNTVYERELEGARGDAAAAEVYVKLANLSTHQLAQTERAIGLWRRVLDLRGEDAEALAALAPLYEKQSAWPELVDVLERQVDIASDDDERVNGLSRRARIFSDRLVDDVLAAETWLRVFEIDPANLAALRALAAIRRRQGDPQELTLALAQIIERAGGLLDEEELKDLYRELAKTYQTALGQPFDALETWQKLLEVGPDAEAFDALEALFVADEQWVDAIGVKMRRAGALTDLGEKVAELREAAAMWTERAFEPDGAREAFEAMLGLDASCDDAFQALEGLHGTANRWENLIELYLGRLETRENSTDRAHLLRQAAQVFEDKLGDKNQALDALLNALAEDLFDQETVRHLERMAQGTGRWGEVIAEVAKWHAAETDKERKIRLSLYLARWYGDELNHPEYAQPYFAQALQIDPNHVGALREVAAFNRRSSNWQQASQLLTRALEVAAIDEDRKVLLTDLGELLDQHLGQTEQALGHFKRALDIDPYFLPALGHLERIYAQRGQYRELADILGSKLPALSAGADGAKARLRLATMFEQQLSEPERAADFLREVLSVEPSHRLALRALARVAAQLESWVELDSVLERELALATTDRERVDALLSIADLAETQFLKAEIASQRLEQVIEIDATSDAALTALARVYRKQRRWDDLLRTYERHVDVAVDKETKIGVQRAMADLYADELNEPYRAIDTYRNIVAIDDTNTQALDALARLYDKVGEGASAIEWMTRVAELTADPQQRVEAFYRIGKSLEEKIGDKFGAQDRYEAALEVNPDHVPSIAALRAIALDNAEYERTATFLDREQALTQNPRQRSRLLAELGRVRSEYLADRDGARAAWEAAYESDADNEEAAAPLVDDLMLSESWERAEPLLELLARKSAKRDRAEQATIQKNLGKVFAALGKFDKALKAYASAVQLDMTDREAVLGLAEAAFSSQDWASALTNFQKVLTSLGDSEESMRADVYFKLGRVKQAQGQPKQAINNFEKALGADSGHRATLDALVSLYSDANDWKNVGHYKRQVLDSVFDGAERFRLLLEIADVCIEKENNAAKAIEALEEARDLQPSNSALLQRLMPLYQRTESWQKVIDTLYILADLEKDKVRKAKFLYAMAQLYRDKENDQDRALELFSDALDLNPLYLESFERIDKILTSRKDWKGLERAYRKMLLRLSGAGISEPNLEFNLWHFLGIIYRDRLKEIPSAIEAFKMATRCKPDEAQDRQILAELYEATDQTEAAIAEHAIVLKRDPLRVEPYRALYSLYTRLHDYDRSWCMAAALSFLEKATEEEKRFFEEYRPRGMLAVKGRLDNEEWRTHLFHADENVYIGKIFEMVTPAAATAKINALRAAKQLQVQDKKFKQDPATSTVTVARTFGWAAQVLGLQAPELYVRSELSGALVASVNAPPASVAGQTVLSGCSPQELTFIVGKHLTLYRPEHYVRVLFGSVNDLKVLLYAAIKLVYPEFDLPPDLASAAMLTGQEIGKYLEPSARESLRIVVQRFIEDGARADLKRWVQASELTACRAGLLLAGDLAVAKKIIVAEPQLAGDLSPQEKLKELLVFSVSDQYFALRKALGVNVG